MTSNANITIYHRIRGKTSGEFERRFVPCVWHHSGVKFTPTTEGMKAGTNTTNVHTVRIPDLTVEIAVDDCVVVGDGPESVNSVKDLITYDYFKVTGVNYNRTGHNKHIKAVGV